MKTANEILLEKRRENGVSPLGESSPPPDLHQAKEGVKVLGMAITKAAEIREILRKGRRSLPGISREVETSLADLESKLQEMEKYVMKYHRSAQGWSKANKEYRRKWDRELRQGRGLHGQGGRWG